LSHSLEERWAKVWPEALAVWSRYTRLGLPRWCHLKKDEQKEGLTGSFAMIRLNDQTVVISLRQVKEHHLEDYALEVLAHEIGHHVYTPGDLSDAARALARTRRGLPSVEQHAPMVLNLYEDLLINDRLVRFHGLRIGEVYQALARANKGKPSACWSLYMRAYEILWGLQPQSLGGAKLEPAAEGDAQLVARLVRVYANDWIEGAGGFAVLMLPYLLKSKDQDMGFGSLLDATAVGAGSDAPPGLTELDGGEILHPSHDPRVVGTAPMDEESEQSDQKTSASNDLGGGEGQSREPLEFGQLLRALGLNLSDHEAAILYYRERAIPHLIPFPSKVAPESSEPLMEGLDPWDIGSPIEDVDWLQSVLLSPTIFPGQTTVQRSWGKMSGKLPKPEPLDLDLYVDCSGSIPNPQRQISYITLAGAIVVLSALRAGSRVQATLWSGAGEFDTTRGFIRDEKALLGVLTGYLGGGTSFPNHILRTTYENRTERDRPAHLLVLSDEGVDTMQFADEKGQDGMAIAKMAMQRARGGGTMVLNLYNVSYLDRPFFTAARGMGWNIFPVSDWESLVGFAREFSRLKYANVSNEGAARARPR
jgi:hypothetical protein